VRAELDESYMGRTSVSSSSRAAVTLSKAADLRDNIFSPETRPVSLSRASASREVGIEEVLPVCDVRKDRQPLGRRQTRTFTSKKPTVEQARDIVRLDVRRALLRPPARARRELLLGDAKPHAEASPRRTLQAKVARIRPIPSTSLTLRVGAGVRRAATRRPRKRSSCPSRSRA